MTRKRKEAAKEPKMMKEIREKLKNKEILLQKIKARDIYSGECLQEEAAFFFHLGTLAEHLPPTSTIGYMMALRDENGEIRTGFSMVSMEDRFSREIGLQMAYGRALKNEGLDGLKFPEMKMDYLYVPNGRIKVRLFQRSSTMEKNAFMKRCSQFFSRKEGDGNGN